MNRRACPHLHLVHLLLISWDIRFSVEFIDLWRNVRVVERLLTGWNQGAYLGLRCCQSLILWEIYRELARLAAHLICFQSINAAGSVFLGLVSTIDLIINVLVTVLRYLLQ